MQDLRVKINGVELQVREYENKNEAIIFLHFGGSNLMMWQRALPYFQNHYRLITPDLRGHGRSDAPDGSYHIDKIAQDIATLMNTLDIEQAHILGSSLGAEVGLSLAAHFPEKTLSLICEGALHSEFGPYGVWEKSEAEYKEYAAARLESMRNTPEETFPSVDALIQKSQEVYEKYGWWNEYVEAVERYDIREITAGEYVNGWGKKVRESYTKDYLEYRFEEYYKEVKCPLLMLPGEDLLQDERAKIAMHGLNKLVKDSQIIEVSEWIHPYGWLLNPEKMCATILEFLREKTA